MTITHFNIMDLTLTFIITGVVVFALIIWFVLSLRKGGSTNLPRKPEGPTTPAVPPSEPPAPPTPPEAPEV